MAASLYKYVIESHTSQDKPVNSAGHVQSSTVIMASPSTLVIPLINDSPVMLKANTMYNVNNQTTVVVNDIQFI